MRLPDIICARDVEMNDEHSDHRWTTEATGDLHPVVGKMIERAGIF